MKGPMTGDVFEIVCLLLDPLVEFTRALAS